MDEKKDPETTVINSETPLGSPVPEAKAATPLEAKPQFNPSKKKMTIVVSLAILIALVVGGGFFLWQNSQKQSTPAASPTPIADDSSRAESRDWKTYTNTKYGFTFKYPQNWIHQEQTSIFQVNEAGVPIDQAPFEAFYLEGTEIKRPASGEAGNDLLIVSTEEKDNVNLNNYTYTDKKIDGYPLYQYKEYGFSISGKDKIIHFGLNLNNSEEGSKYIDQILSTFKFTN